MSGGSVTALLEISIRVLVLGLFGALVALALRRAGSQVRHAVWLGVVCAMLALPPVSLLAPRVPVTIAYWTVAAPAGEIAVVPVADGAAPGPAAPRAWRPAWPAVLWVVYALGLGVLLARMALGARRLQRLVAAGRPESVELAAEIVPRVGLDPAACEIRSSEVVAVPFTAGVLRPVVLLPADWREWPRAKLAAVLAHEAAHIARRDWLTARLAGLNRCLFWFHPLAWWLERKLASLAEESADQTALAVVHDARSYAGAILDFALAMQARRLRSMEATAMARSTKVGQRVERILAASRFSPATLRRGVALAIVLCAIPLVYAAAALTPAPQTAAPPPAQVYIRGDLTEDEAPQLESRLAANPADFTARLRLLGYYRQKGDRDKALQHAWWLAENHPERWEALTASLWVLQAASEAEKVRLERLWSRPSENPAVLANAGQVMQALGRLFEAEDCFQRARQLAPGKPSGLEALYVGVLRRPATPGAAGSQFADKVRAELDLTPDAALVGAVGEMLIGAREPQALELAEKYLKRAASLDAGNPRWPQSLARLKDVREPKTETGAAGRIRVGGNVQQDKLVSQVRPQYPPLAKQARIQGTVRLSAVIGTDGDVKHLEVVSGHPLLVPAAVEAVRQWVYKPTLLNGTPVEVITQIDINFALSDVSPGAAGGVPGGAAEGPPYRVGGAVSAPSLARKLEPSFPEALRHQGLTATVVLRVVIGADGKISGAYVTRIDGRPEFGDAALDAVRQWEFKPGTKDGQPVEVEATIEVNFRET
jgi:TonB family protein